MLAAKVGANEIVIPDIQEDRMGTYRVLQDFLMHPAIELWNGGLMAVVQGKTNVDYQDCMDFYLREPSITAIGLPRLMAKYVTKEGRLNAAEYIQSEKAIHCLGAQMWVEEVTALQEQGIVRGLDTSYPYVMAKANKHINLHNPNDYVSRGDHYLYFQEALNHEQIDLCHRNEMKYLALAGVI